jgi:hypothetical protein
LNIPAITGIETALKVYYSNAELGNKEIEMLFGSHSSATVSSLKKIVKKKMSDEGVLSYGANRVNTQVAFEVWGIDIKDLERRMRKIKELSL